MRTNEDEAQCRWASSPRLWDDLRPIAKRMRKEPTAAEEKLWQALRRCGLEGLKFRRQHAIGPFIVDFYCSKARLVIEVDGSIHETTQEQDKARQAFLEARGLKVVRFTNDDVLKNITQVANVIYAAIYE